MKTVFKNVIHSSEEFEDFRSVLGVPGELASRKVISIVDQHCREYIRLSPFLTMATSNKAGECDVSPRGDMPGFVSVLDEKHIFIPERPGNKRLDSVQNIMENPHVGLIFFIPGLGETLRINGEAYIVRDQELLEMSAVNGKLPLFGIGVQVKECYTHCAKAFIRSGLWKPETWTEKEDLPSVPKMIAAHTKIPNVTAEQVGNQLQESYVKRLY